MAKERGLGAQLVGQLKQAETAWLATDDFAIQMSVLAQTLSDFSGDESVSQNFQQAVNRYAVNRYHADVEAPDDINQRRADLEIVAKELNDKGEGIRGLFDDGSNTNTSTPLFGYLIRRKMAFDTVDAIAATGNANHRQELQEKVDIHSVLLSDAPDCTEVAQVYQSLQEQGLDPLQKRMDPEALARFHEANHSRPDRVPANRYLEDVHLQRLLAPFRNQPGIFIADPMSKDNWDRTDVQNGIRRQLVEGDNQIAVVPINNAKGLGAGDHWTLAVALRIDSLVQGQEPQLHLFAYDSMKKANPDSWAAAARVLQGGATQPVIIHDLSAQHQKDGYSCGYRVDEAAELFLHRFIDNQRNGRDQSSLLGITSKDIGDAFNGGQPYDTDSLAIRYNAKLNGQYVTPQDANKFVATQRAGAEAAKLVKNPPENRAEILNRIKAIRNLVAYGMDIPSDQVDKLLTDKQIEDILNKKPEDREKYLKELEGKWKGLETTIQTNKKVKPFDMVGSFLDSFVAGVEKLDFNNLFPAAFSILELFMTMAEAGMKLGTGISKNIKEIHAKEREKEPIEALQAAVIAADELARQQKPSVEQDAASFKPPITKVKQGSAGKEATSHRAQVQQQEQWKNLNPKNNNGLSVF